MSYVLSLFIVFLAGSAFSAERWGFCDFFEQPERSNFLHYPHESSSFVPLDPSMHRLNYPHTLKRVNVAFLDVENSWFHDGTTPDLDVVRMNLHLSVSNNKFQIKKAHSFFIDLHLVGKDCCIKYGSEEKGCKWIERFSYEQKQKEGVSWPRVQMLQSPEKVHQKKLFIIKGELPRDQRGEGVFFYLMWSEQFRDELELSIDFSDGQRTLYIWNVRSPGFVWGKTKKGSSPAVKQICKFPGQMYVEAPENPNMRLLYLLNEEMPNAIALLEVARFWKDNSVIKSRIHLIYGHNSSLEVVYRDSCDVDLDLTNKRKSIILCRSHRYEYERERSPITWGCCFYRKRHTAKDFAFLGVPVPYEKEGKHTLCKFFKIFWGREEYGTKGKLFFQMTSIEHEEKDRMKGVVLWDLHY